MGKDPDPVKKRPETGEKEQLQWKGTATVKRNSYGEKEQLRWKGTATVKRNSYGEKDRIRLDSDKHHALLKKFI